MFFQYIGLSFLSYKFFIILLTELILAWNETAKCSHKVPVSIKNSLNDEEVQYIEVKIYLKWGKNSVWTPGFAKSIVFFNNKILMECVFVCVCVSETPVCLEKLANFSLYFIVVTDVNYTTSIITRQIHKSVI